MTVKASYIFALSKNIKMKMNYEEAHNQVFPLPLAIRNRRFIKSTIKNKELVTLTGPGLIYIEN